MAFPMASALLADQLSQSSCADAGEQEDAVSRAATRAVGESRETARELMRYPRSVFSTRSSCRRRCGSSDFRAASRRICDRYFMEAS